MLHCFNILRFYLNKIVFKFEYDSLNVRLTAVQFLNYILHDPSS